MQELLNKSDVMRIINSENAVVLCCTRLRSTDEVLFSITSKINSLQTIQTTIEAEPVRHGRWIKQENGMNVCSACCVTKVSHFPFCGNCGARMDGGAGNVSNV